MQMGTDQTITSDPTENIKGVASVPRSRSGWTNMNSMLKRAIENDLELAEELSQALITRRRDAS